MTAVYEASSVKSRKRSTNVELAELDDAIVTAVEQDRPVTLRGVFYRAVSAGAVDKTEPGYLKVGRQLSKLRAAGRVSYGDITDGTRWTITPTMYSSVEQALENAALSYRRQLWADQPVKVQIYSEKDAITGAIKRVTNRWGVPLGIVRGYSSDTFAWSVANSLKTPVDTYVYQLGDHDPSGVDAWRSFQEKVLGHLTPRQRARVHFDRLAVTPEQIEAYALPTRPTKKSDTRAGGFAGESVEVDAIPASELRRIVEEAITQHVDQEQLRLTRAVEASERDLMTSLMDYVDLDHLTHLTEDA